MKLVGTAPSRCRSTANFDRYRESREFVTAMMLFVQNQLCDDPAGSARAHTATCECTVAASDHIFFGSESLSYVPSFAGRSRRSMHSKVCAEDTTANKHVELEL